MQMQQRLVPFFSYPSQAQQAAEFYVSVFPDARILRSVPNGMTGDVMLVEYELMGMKFVGLNTGQDWKFTEAFSLSVKCETQEEIDYLWDRLLEGGGEEMACAWLKDQFGMCWQIVPAKLDEWLSSPEPEKTKRMFEQLWQMKKLNIATLQQAFDGQ
jgi:predicted 3-demethylubiquinone-9 3-methyltransferase (glyoxalase superfamily)